MRISSIPKVVALLACPLCSEPLTVASDAALSCTAGHTFDVSREGYVSLLAGKALTSTADTPAMIAARETFLSAGHYEPIRDAVAQVLSRTLAEKAKGAIVEVGAGTGYYLAGALESQPGRVGISLDTSKPALRRAARIHDRAGAVACDVWGRMPIRDKVAAAVLDIFAPRNIAEMARIIAPGGVVMVVTPRPGHLAELVGILGLLNVDERKADRLEGKMAGHFAVAESLVVKQSMALTRADIAALAGMGPSAYHTDKAALEARIAGLPESTPVTLEVTVAAYLAL